MNRLIVQGEGIYWDKDSDKGDLYNHYRLHIANGNIAIETTPEEEYLSDKQLITNLQVENSRFRADLAAVTGALQAARVYVSHHDDNDVLTLIDMAIARLEGGTK